RGGTEIVGDRAFADLVTVAYEHDSERGLLVNAFADHQLVALLEDMEGQLHSGAQDSLQRKEREVHAGTQSTVGGSGRADVRVSPIPRTPADGRSRSSLPATPPPCGCASGSRNKSSRGGPLAEAATAEHTKRPIVPFLKLPENDSDQPYLIGSRCKNCGATYL